MRKEFHSLVVALVTFFSAVGILAAEDHAQFKVGSLTFDRPEKFAWVDIQPGMRAAQLKVAGEEGKHGEVVFFKFPAGSGGGVAANIDRWLGMFQEGKDKINARTSKVTKDQGTINYVQAEGTYMSGLPGGPKTAQPNAMLLGAIIETENDNVFIRMTGPATLVKASEADFKTMVESAVK